MTRGDGGGPPVKSERVNTTYRATARGGVARASSRCAAANRIISPRSGGARKIVRFRLARLL